MMRWSPFTTSRLLIFVALLAFAGARTPSAHTGSVSLAERVKAYDESAIATLRMINVAQITYQGGDETKGFARRLMELGPAGVQMIDAAAAESKKDGYYFRLTPEHKSDHRPIKHYVLTGPIKRLLKDQRSFFTDETGVIRFTSEDRPASIADPPINP